MSSLGLGAGHRLQLNMVMVVDSSGQGFIRPQSTNSDALGNNNVGDQQNEESKEDVQQEGQIQNGHSSEAGLLQVALGRTFNAADNIKKAVAAFRDEGIHVKGEPSLQLPEALEAKGSTEAKVSKEEPWVAGKGDRGEGGDG